MRMIIASDIHGSPESAALLRAETQKLCPDLVVLLGDLLYHGPRNPLPAGYTPSDVVTILSDLGAPLLAVRGNCDADVDQYVLPFHLAESAWLFVDGLRILAVHGHQLSCEHPFAKAAPGSVVLSGHTHIPLAEKRGDLFYWNPGSPTLPKAGWPPSYGLYEDGEFRVVTLDGEVLLRHRPV